MKIKEENKLIAVIMGQNCEQTISMCLESVKEADEIIYLDGGSTNELWKDFKCPKCDEWWLTFKTNKCHNCNFNGFKILKNKFDKSNPNAISEQRNFYLNYLKENYNDDDWVLVLDSDEVLDTDGIKKIKEYIINNKFDVANIKMRHLIYNLSYEDATQEIHMVQRRLFKLNCNLFYPIGEHCILAMKNNSMLHNIDITIWHLGYLGGAWDVKKRFDQQLNRNNGHTKEFLHNWNKIHMLGRYPVKKINPNELPEVILNNFGIDKDELYFEGRGLETKHFIDAIHWRDYFKPNKVLEWGCGLGHRVYALLNCGVKTVGLELSDYAVNNNLIEFIIKADLSKDIGEEITDVDLVIAYDVLEHINYKDLDAAINNLIKTTNKNILVSIPYKGTLNCDADPTHIIKEDRDWWIKQFTDKGLKEVEVPEHFLYKEQLLIFLK